MQVTGKITRIGKLEEGTSKAGKAWKKVTFVVETSDDYNNIYPFTIFGEEKVDKFLQYNKVGYSVDVDFNISAREWQDKYFVDLQAWKVFKAQGEASNQPEMTEEEAGDDLPF